jgi:putative transcriptional regulator
MNEAFEELKSDLDSGKPLSNPPYTVRTNKSMSKEEFSSIRKDLDLTQAQLAEVLDISIKTVQAYEQGRIEPPGLAAKVLRIMRSNAFFRNIFQGNVDPKDYSQSAEFMYSIDQMNANTHLMEAFENWKTKTQILNMTETGVLQINEPEQCEDKNAR